MNKEELVRLWQNWDARGKQTPRTPEILAGQFIDWSDGNLERAASYLDAHSTGLYADMPYIPEAAKARDIIRSL